MPTRKRNERLLLHLSGGSAVESGPDNNSDFERTETEQGIPQSPGCISFENEKETGTARRFRCGFEGCEKSYKKPSRLEEHERSHTGEVSFSPFLEYHLNQVNL